MTEPATRTQPTLADYDPVVDAFGVLEVCRLFVEDESAKRILEHAADYLIRQPERKKSR